MEQSNLLESEVDPLIQPLLLEEANDLSSSDAGEPSGNCCLETSLSALEDIQTLPRRLLIHSDEDKPDFSTQYCSFVARFHKLILGVIFFIVMPYGLVAFPQFLKNTDASMHPIPGSDSDQAIRLFRQVYGPQSGKGLRADDPMNPGMVILLLLNNDTDSFVDGYSDSYLVAKNYSLGLQHYLSEKVPFPTPSCFEDEELILPSVVVQSYYSLMDANLYTSASKMTTHDGKSTFLSISYNIPSCLYNSIQGVHNIQQAYGYQIMDLLDLYNADHNLALSHQNISLGCTGMLPFRKDMTKSLSKDMRRMHFIVLPLALVLFAYGLQGHILLVAIPLFCILTTISVWSMIMNLIIKFSGIQITQFTPNVMITLTFGLGIDYNIFLLSRVLSEFRRLLSIQSSTVMADKSIKSYSIYMMVKHAAHTVIVSGVILLSTFIGLQCLQITSIKSVSLGASISIISSILVTLILVPAIITSSLGTQLLDLCVCTYKDRNEYGPLGFQMVFERMKHYFNRAPENDDSSEIRLTADTDNVENEYTSFRDLLGNNFEADGTYELDHSEHVFSSRNPEFAIFSGNVSTPSLSQRENYVQVDLWGKFGKFICHKGRASLILLVVFAMFVPIAMDSLKLQTSLQFEKMLPRGSPSFHTLQKFMQTYGDGSLSTYRLVFASKKEKRVDTREGFRILQTVMQSLEEVSDMVSVNCTSIAWANKKSIPIESLSLAKECQKLCPIEALRELAALYSSTTTSDGMATIASCTLSADPYGEEGVNWLQAARLKIESLSSDEGLSTFDYKLFGGASVEFDSSNVVVSQFSNTVSWILTIVSLLIAIFFRSIVSPLRSFVTIVLTTFTSYGILAQHCQGSKISWLTPILSFTVIIGLTVDYDVFLTARVLEESLSGASHENSVKIGIMETGRIITSAGLVMATSFGGLLFSDTDLVREWSLLLVASVLIDTFITRTMVSPSLMILTGKYCWWPRKLSEEQ